MFQSSLDYHQYNMNVTKKCYMVKNIVCINSLFQMWQRTILYNLAYSIMKRIFINSLLIGFFKVAVW